MGYRPVFNDLTNISINNQFNECSTSQPQFWPQPANLNIKQQLFGSSTPLSSTPLPQTFQQQPQLNLNTQPQNFENNVNGNQPLPLTPVLQTSTPQVLSPLVPSSAPEQTGIKFVDCNETLLRSWFHTTITNILAYNPPPFTKTSKQQLNHQLYLFFRSQNITVFKMKSVSVREVLGSIATLYPAMYTPSHLNALKNSLLYYMQNLRRIARAFNHNRLPEINLVNMPSMPEVQLPVKR